MGENYSSAGTEWFRLGAARRLNHRGARRLNHRGVGRGADSRLWAMARYFDVHPRDPQPRSISQIVAMLREGALIAYPTDSCYALGCTMENRDGAERIRRLRDLDDRHHFTL